MRRLSQGGGRAGGCVTLVGGIGNARVDHALPSPPRPPPAARLAAPRAGVHVKTEAAAASEERPAAVLAGAGHRHLPRYEAGGACEVERWREGVERGGGRSRGTLRP
jgi:hypothetical protein